MKQRRYFLFPFFFYFSRPRMPPSFKNKSDFIDWLKIYLKNISFIFIYYSLTINSKPFRRPTIISSLHLWTYLWFPFSGFIFSINFYEARVKFPTYDRHCRFLEPRPGPIRGRHGWVGQCQWQWQCLKKPKDGQNAVSQLVPSEWPADLVNRNEAATKLISRVTACNCYFHVFSLLGPNIYIYIYVYI